MEKEMEATLRIGVRIGIMEKKRETSSVAYWG